MENYKKLSILFKTMQSVFDGYFEDVVEGVEFTMGKGSAVTVSILFDYKDTLKYIPATINIKYTTKDSNTYESLVQLTNNFLSALALQFEAQKYTAGAVYFSRCGALISKIFEATSSRYNALEAITILEGGDYPRLIVDDQLYVTNSISKTQDQIHVSHYNSLEDTVGDLQAVALDQAFQDLYTP